MAASPHFFILRLSQSKREGKAQPNMNTDELPCFTGSRQRREYRLIPPEKCENIFEVSIKKNDLAMCAEESSFQKNVRIQQGVCPS
jgi:hypothetical protein